MCCKFITFITNVEFILKQIRSRPVASGGAGGAIAPQFLAEQLTLSQPGGQIMPTTVLRAPPDV